MHNLTVVDPIACLDLQDPTGQVTFKHGDKTLVGKKQSSEQNSTPTT